MPITRVNAIRGSGTLDASLNAVISLTGLTIQQNDVLVVACCLAKDTVDLALSASGNNSGACSEQADLYANDTRDANLGVYVAKQGATADTSITVSTGGTSGNPFVYQVIQYRGVDTTTQIDVATTTATGIDTDLANPPSITPTTSGARIVAIYAAAQQADTAWGTPANVSNFIQDSDGGTEGGVSRIASADKDWTSGAFDPDAIPSGNNDPRASWAAATLALRPISGTTYHDSLTESASAADSLANAQTFANSLSEAAAPADSLSNAQTFANSLTEAASASDSLATTGTFGVAISEAVSAADSVSGGIVHSTSLAESVTPSDSVAATQTFANSLNEAVAAADSMTTLGTFGVTLSEAASASDSLAAGLVQTQSLTESVSAADSLAGGVTIAYTLSESVSPSDSLISVVIPPWELMPHKAVAALSWTLDKKDNLTRSGWTGSGTVVADPWHRKWRVRVELAGVQNDEDVRKLRSFFAKRKGELEPFRLYATAGKQNSNSGVTVSTAAAAGATSMAISGAETTLKDGQFVTVNGQLLCLTADQSGSTINFRPPLRQQAAVGTIVVTSRPYAFVYMGPTAEWEIGRHRVVKAAFVAEEAMLETDPDPVPETA